LPVYNFLCDLQTQELQSGLTFKWESLSSNVKFLPRVTFKKTILYPATWYLHLNDVRSLAGSDAGNLAERFLAFRKTWQLPRFFTLNDGDAELLVDAENPLTVQTWLEAIKHRSSIKLREFLFDPAQSVVTDLLDRPYVNQFIALLMREKPAYPLEADAAHYFPAGQKSKFWLGSEWLYYKLYCGLKSSDRILTEAIGPLAEELRARNLVDQWFFIRYADPGTHLRVRFHLPDSGRIGEVVLLINQYLEPYLVKEYIWKIQTDTYVRELERYGDQGIDLAEALFFHDSVAAIAILEQTTGDEHEPLRWLWGVRSIDELLNAFSFTLPDKYRLLEQLKEAFGREFGMNKNLKLQLDAKYRSNKKMIRQFLDRAEDLRFTYPDVFGLISRRDEHIDRMAKCIRQLAQEEQPGVSLNALVGDYIHMLLNRLIPVNQRLHEMIIYDFLFRHYQGVAATRKV
jgi:thiopeptide-type bacteriocin biosynthesis protein